MITASNIALAYGKRILFKDVNIKFIPGNCYGLIGANGAGKSTFLKILSGELSADSGNISIGKNKRIAVWSDSDRPAVFDCLFFLLFFILSSGSSGL